MGLNEPNWGAIRAEWAKDAQERADAIALQTLQALRGEKFGNTLGTRPKRKPKRLHECAK